MGVNACVGWMGLGKLAALAGLGLMPFWAQADLPKVRQAPVLAALPADASLQPRTIVLKKIVAHTTNAVIGEAQRGALCSDSEPVRFNAQTVNAFSRLLFGQYRQKIQSLGYPVLGQPNPNRSVFETEEAKREPDFELGLTLKSLEARLCSKSANETQGGVWMQVRWEVFSPKAQKVLLDVTTEGTYQNEQAEKLGVGELYGRAFGAAANNLLAQPAYFDLLHGKTPIPEPEKPKPIRIKAVPEPADSVAASYQQLLASTLTLLDGTRSGSGFLVSTDGYLLTNQHVVGEQKFMKVRFSNGTEQIAELVRSNRVRDVALLKLPTPVAGALHVKFRPPAPGEDAYVIGSPLGKTFAGTLTRGVISGSRQLNGVNYIQSDVRILPGSSGGPLFDAQSRVVGMAVRAVNSGLSGINLFIPIEEAFKALSVEVE